MIILKLSCGLGNQLFEYAFARAVMHQLNEKKIYLDSSWYDKELDGRTMNLFDFNLPKDTLAISKFKSFYFQYRSKIIRRIAKYYSDTKKFDSNILIAKYGIYDYNFEYCPKLSDGQVHYLEGIFQNRNYFKCVDGEIRKIYLSYKINAKNENLMNEIKDNESVCVHIRLGDYRKNKRWREDLFICTEKYYNNAINYVKENVMGAKFYCFSNSHEDLEWIKNNYHLPSDVIYVDMNNKDIDDFALMCACKHFIISNSSFSWWAQYLGDSVDKIVVAPTFWDTKKNKYEGIYLDNWVLLPPN